jgi:hypothetical protein
MQNKCHPTSTKVQRTARCQICVSYQLETVRHRTKGAVVDTRSGLFERHALVEAIAT